MDKLSAADQARLEQIMDEFTRTHVTFRHELVDVVGGCVYWKVIPVIHEEPVPSEDMSDYLTGDGVPPREGGGFKDVPPAP